VAPLDVKPRVVGHGKVLEAQIDHGFLGTDYSRKVYIVRDDGVDMKWPETMHVGNVEEIVYPLVVEGEIYIAYKDGDEIACEKLATDRYYRIRPHTPHQVRVKGRAVVEVYSPTRSLISPDHKVGELETDAFPDVDARGVKRRRRG